MSESICPHLQLICSSGECGMTILIREMTDADAMMGAEMRHALRSFATADENLSEIAKILAAPDMWGHVALDEADAAAGFAEVALRRYANGCEESPVPFLEGIWVSPAFRRRGVGEHLIARISAVLQAKGFKELCSDALLDNTASHEAHGAWALPRPSGWANSANRWRRAAGPSNARRGAIARPRRKARDRRQIRRD